MIAANLPDVEPCVVIQGVSKRYASGVDALQPIDLHVSRGAFVSVVGPSGCGKSTLLRVLAGLVEPSSGQVHRAAGLVSAFVFQEPALLPWLDVQKNAELLMKLENKYGTATRAWEAQEALRMVGLAGFERSFPHQLSGGMRMRLSLARAIALKPDLLLLDEPLGAVDQMTRDILQDELLQLWSAARFAAVLITHSVEEAVYLSQRIIVLSKRPGQVIDVIDVGFDQPRNAALRSSAQFAAFVGRITEILRT